MEHPDISIRPYRIEDAAKVFEAVRNSLSELIPWMPWCHPEYTMDETLAWLEIQVPAFERGENFEFAIESGDGNYLGGCGLNQIDKANLRANLGYWVSSSAARRGVATAAVRLLRDWGFKNADLIRLEIVIAAENAASHKVAQKSGARLEGIAQSRLMLHGIAHDASIFSFIRKDYIRF